jgi:hypothetical protein
LLAFFPIGNIDRYHFYVGLGNDFFDFAFNRAKAHHFAAQFCEPRIAINNG